MEVSIQLIPKAASGYDYKQTVSSFHPQSLFSHDKFNMPDRNMQQVTVVQHQSPMSIIMQADLQ